jgi:cytochrome P450
MKKVIAPEGVRIPSGEHLPYGSKVGVTSYAIHHDESIYKDAYTFDAFRFCKSPEGRECDSKESHTSTSMVTSADNFMAFSHGRHAW